MPGVLVLLVLLLVGGFPAVASAARLTVRVEPDDGAVYGEEHVLRGVLTENGRPVRGAVVVLESRSVDREAYARLETATTGRDGRYAIARAFGRNARLRMSAAGARAASASVSVFPRARVSVRTVARNVVSISQTLTGPRSARIEGTTRFYLGPRGARTAALAGSARVRRTGPGRAIARARLRVPARFRGRFSFAACFRARAGTTMGDPSVRCPSTRFEL